MSWWGLQAITALVLWGVGGWLTRWWELRPIEGFVSSTGGHGGGGEEGEELMNGHAPGSKREDGVEMEEMG